MEEVSIPTFIINLKRRDDRRKYIEEEFARKPEFSINIVEAIEHGTPAIGLYLTLKLLIKKAQDIGYEFVLVCEDDHQFTSFYNKTDLIDNIHDLDNEGADVFLGGVSWFDYLKENKNQKYLLNSFTGTQFMVIYSRFYTSLINGKFRKSDTIDRWIARLSSNIYMSVPMISIQKDFGYSDVTEKNNSPGKVQGLFTDTIKRLESLAVINNHIKSSKKLALLSEEECEGIQISTYLIPQQSADLQTAEFLNQFISRKEFEIIDFLDLKAEANSHDYWSCLRQIIQMSNEREDDVIVICDNEHVFCEDYDKRVLFSSIFQGAYLGADIILGGMSDTRQVVVVNDYLSWIDAFQYCPFMIVYRSFFELIMDSNFVQTDISNHLFSELTFNKYVIHPSISSTRKIGFAI